MFIDMVKKFVPVNTARMSKYYDICIAAERMSVLPELLVDEAYYYNRCGFAVYRIAFAAYSKGMKLSEVIKTVRVLGYRKVQLMSMMHFLRGHITPDLSFKFVLDLCHVVDLPLYKLCRPLKEIREISTVYSHMRDVVSRLDEASIAAMVGFGALLASRDEALVRAGTDKLIDWWVGACERRRCGTTEPNNGI